MRNLVVARSASLLANAILIATLLSSLVAVSAVAAAGGNVDAARACQQGGYATLRGTDGTLFKNAGECVSHVARGGAITGVSTGCTYVPGTSGCIELDDVFVPIGTSGTNTTGTTLAGMFTFAPVTSWGVTTVVTVTGSGTWVTSAGPSGTWTAKNIRGYYPTAFWDTDTNPATGTLCGAPETDDRRVGVDFDLFDASGVAAGTIQIGIRFSDWGTNGVTYQGYGGSGEPYGLHNAVATAPSVVTGITWRC